MRQGSYSFFAIMGFVDYVRVRFPASRHVVNRPTPKSLPRKRVVVVDNCSMHKDPQVKELMEGGYEGVLSNEIVVLRDETANALPRV